MRNAAILCFSDTGRNTAERIAAALSADYDTQIVRPGRGELAAVVRTCFSSVDAMIFVGSCGIAVRAIAPHVVSKTSDPAVIVCDELGIHVISLLSGHIGGANQLTGMIAERINAKPVITTATDINHRFSVDAWAAGNKLLIDSMCSAKNFAAEILKHDLPMESEFPVEGTYPPGIFAGKSGELGVCISIKNSRPFRDTLLLVPRIVHLGVGCKHDAPVDNVWIAVQDAIKSLGIDPRCIADLSSIDIKANEAGIIESARRLNAPFRTYSAEELNRLSGVFSVSEFVRGTVGVDCVCERAAVFSAGSKARLIMKKTKYSGVTCAAAIEDWRVSF